jgi:hypothetical protein
MTRFTTTLVALIALLGTLALVPVTAAPRLRRHVS